MWKLRENYQLCPSQLGLCYSWLSILHEPYDINDAEILPITSSDINFDFGVWKDMGNAGFLGIIQTQVPPLGCVHTIELCSMNFASYRARISEGFYAGVQVMTVRIIEVEHGNCGFAVS